MGRIVSGSDFRAIAAELHAIAVTQCLKRFNVAPEIDLKDTRSSHFNYQMDIVGQRLYSMKAGHKSHRQISFNVHLATQEEILLQIFFTEIIFSEKKKKAFESISYHSIG